MPAHDGGMVNVLRLTKGGGTEQGRNAAADCLTRGGKPDPESPAGFVVANAVPDRELSSEILRNWSSHDLFEHMKMAHRGIPERLEKRAAVGDALALCCGRSGSEQIVPDLSATQRADALETSPLARSS